MDNTVFNKRLKIGAIVVASVVAVLLIVWFATRVGHGCININNYAEALTFEEALQVVFDSEDISIDPNNYKNYEESIRPYESYINCSLNGLRILGYIDNYRLFLSEDAECNIDGESLKSFICKISSDESFLKSRLSDMMKNHDINIGELPNFKFCCEIESVTSMYGEKSLCIGRINSWQSLEKNSATFVRSNNNRTIDAYVFSRIKGEWQLTLHLY